MSDVIEISPEEFSEKMANADVVNIYKNTHLYRFDDDPTFYRERSQTTYGQLLRS